MSEDFLINGQLIAEVEVWNIVLYIIICGCENNSQCFGVVRNIGTYSEGTCGVSPDTAILGVVVNKCIIAIYLDKLVLGKESEIIFVRIDFFDIKKKFSLKVSCLCDRCSLDGLDIGV